MIVLQLLLYFSFIKKENNKPNNHLKVKLHNLKEYNLQNKCDIKEFDTDDFIVVDDLSVFNNDFVISSFDKKQFYKFRKITPQ